MKKRKNKKQKILLATGIFPPDIGGPATFSKALFDGLRAKGEDAEVLTFGDFKKKEKSIEFVGRNCNIFCRYFKYFWRLHRKTKRAKILYTFDLISAGLPSVFVKILRPDLKFIIRLGGDYQWERAIQAGWTKKKLRDYYADKNFSLKEKVIYRLNNFVLNRADVVIFNSEFIRDVYIKQRGFENKKNYLIRNILPEINSVSQKEKKEQILYIGRISKVKNLEKLVKAFRKIKEKKIKLKIIGDGPQKNDLVKDLSETDNVEIKDSLPHKQVLEEMSSGKSVVIPSLTEANSNIAIEALMVKTAVVLTRESEAGFINFTHPGLFYINPEDEDDIISGIKKSLDTEFDFSQNNLDNLAWPLEKVIDKHLQVFYEKSN